MSKKKNKTPPEQRESIHDEMKTQREQAIAAAKKHVDTKPIKYLLKN